MKAGVNKVAAASLLLLAVQLLSDAIVPGAAEFIRPASSSGLQIRHLSIADGRKHGHTDDDDDQASETNTDDDKTSTKKAVPSPYSTTTSTEDTSAIEAPTTSSKSTTNTTKPKLSSNSTDGVKTDDNTDSNSTSTGTNGTAAAEKKDSGGVSEWTFHNITAANDMLYNVSASNATSILPREAQQTETWAFTVLGIFTGLAILLCGITAYRRRRYGKRQNYEEIESLVV